ncbi:protein artichoke-like [Microplitis mediator]|uniref:protein artichoke-like n=1 Tax=Microplitis mediator TaxID=375433 RepID=UPI0025521A29|nr:protein artichoke-like [Microplitis mediator]
MYFIVIVLLINFLKSSSGNLCQVCVCSGATIDCNGRLNSSDTNILKLLTSELTQEIILSSDNTSLEILNPKDKIEEFKIVDLSENNLNESAINALTSLINLKELNFSLNNWKALTADVFDNFLSLSKLDLSHNLIAEISTRPCNLTHLDLSYNRLKILTARQLNCPQLKFINLSYNLITSINGQAFVNLNSLSTLLLNNNFIQSLDIFCPSLKNLSVAHNKLSHLPSNLSVDFLDIKHNFISTIQTNPTANHLKSLDISRNNLSLINATFINLKILNISYNYFSSIPPLSVKNSPALEEFIISGNPLTKLIFNQQIKLKRFIASDLNKLESIDEDSFDLLRAHDDSCINLTISSNKNLKSLHDNAFKNLHVCYLDLSNNGLERISRRSVKILNESIPKYGINLQGNPLICDCESQWMLDDLLPKLYGINSALLANLRCNKPTEVFNVRMVHWYKWKTKVLCKSSIKFERLVAIEDNTYTVAQSSTIIIKSSNSAKFIIIGAATVLSLITIIGLTLSEKLAKKHRRRNRRL